MTQVSLMDVRQDDGPARVAGAWSGPVENSPSTAVAGGVLYVQGHPGAKPTTEMQGRIVYQGGKRVEHMLWLPGGHLNAIDLATRTVLWSFSRPTAEANWPFGGYVIPVDGVLLADSGPGAGQAPVGRTFARSASARAGVATRRVHVSPAALPRWWRCRSSSSASSLRRHALPHRHQPQAHRLAHAG